MLQILLQRLYVLLIANMDFLIVLGLELCLLVLLMLGQ